MPYKNKEKRNEYNRQRYKDNREKELKRSKQYLKNNQEKERKRKKQWEKDHPEYKKQWEKNNSEKVEEYKRQWKKNNPGKAEEASNRWRKNNPEYHNQYRKNRRKIDLKFNLSNRMAKTIWQSLHNNKNGKHWERLVKYTLNDLIKKLKKTMPKGYDWEDYLKGKLHIDHKIPISAFNFTKSEHTDFKRCWALSNLRLLPARENRIKSNKLSKPFQPALKI